MQVRSFTGDPPDPEGRSSRASIPGGPDRTHRSIGWKSGHNREGEGRPPVSLQRSTSSGTGPADAPQLPPVRGRGGVTGPGLGRRGVGCGEAPGSPAPVVRNYGLATGGTGRSSTANGAVTTNPAWAAIRAASRR